MRLVSLVGRDEPGRRLFKVLPRTVERAGLSRPGGYRTPVKTRILAGGIHSAKQQVVRIDRYSSEPVSDAQRKVAERAAVKAIRQADAVLVSDYGSGLVTPRFVAELASRLRRRGVPILIDSRYALTQVSRPHRVHAERIGSRAGARRHDRRSNRACSSAPAARCSSARAWRAC